MNYPIVIIACKIFQNLIESHLPQDLAGKLTFLDYGLHRVPKQLRASVQAEIDALPQASLVVLGYGLCGNGLAGIHAGIHTLLIPRTDDCIAILLGSYISYLQQFQEHPGTYYLTKGWLESGSNPLKEFLELKEKYGEQEATWMMDTQYQHYNRVALVAHTQKDLDAYRAQAQEVADYCSRWGMEYEEILGSDRYVRDLVRAIETNSRNGQVVGADFVLVPPGGSLEQAQFMRDGGT
jgi:hypothetical protein